MLALLGFLGIAGAGFLLDAALARNEDDASDMDDAPDPAAGAAPETATVGDLLRGLDADDGPDAEVAQSANPKAGADADSAGGSPAAPPIAGTEAGDKLSGWAADDRIDGRGGLDQIIGRGGDDRLAGGAGEDYLSGGSGQDRLAGDADNDHLSGDAGADSLAGGTGHDQLLGDSGNDMLRGGAGGDTLLGGTGHDRLLGNNGDDWLQGGFGNDRLLGGPGADTLDGDFGDDTLTGHHDDQADIWTDFLNGGAGNDLIELGAGDYGSGNQGNDLFRLGDWLQEGDQCRIMDFNPAEDQIEIIYDPAAHPDPRLAFETDGQTGDVQVFLDGKPLISVQNAQGLSEHHIQLTAERGAG